MKQKIPLKSIIAVLSVTLFYSLTICLVDKCSDIYDNGLFVGTVDNSENSADEVSASSDASEDEFEFGAKLEPSDEEEKVYTQITWWKAGIEDYELLFENSEVTSSEITTSLTSPSVVQTPTSTLTSPKPTVTTTSATTQPTTVATTTTSATTTTTSATTTTTTTAETTTTTEQTTEPTTTQPSTSEEFLFGNGGLTASSTTGAVTSETTTASENSIPKHDVSNETLTVYDQMTGQTVTGSVLDILIKTTWNEVGNFHSEAIKAQAVAAYTYITYCNNNGIRASVALRNGASQKCINAVTEVAGQGIYYNGKIIQATYCAATGGTTSSSKNVWGNSYAYLTSVESAYDAQGGAYYGKQKTFTESEIRNIIESKTNIRLSNDPANWFTIVSYIDGNYVDDLLIDGNSTCVLTSNGKSRAITGALLRESIMGQSKLLSSQFDVSYADGVFTFTTYGYGHGVGMSQYGAHYYASYAGWTYDQILTHYYQGCVVK